MTISITPELLDEIEARAKAATPGPWKGPVGKKTPYVVRVGDDAYGSVQVAECGDWKDGDLARFNLDRWLADAAHIARMDPSTTVALVAYVREVEAKHACTERDACQWAERYGAAEKERDALAAKLEEVKEPFQRLLDMLDVHGDFKNGVTDSTGTIDEGEVRAGEIIQAARAALSRLTAEPDKGGRLGVLSMSDGPILTGARALTAQIAKLCDTAPSERAVRAVYAFTLRQRAEAWKAERERCAKVAEELSVETYETLGGWREDQPAETHACAIAAAIRKGDA